jgi:hypothetical protein
MSVALARRLLTSHVGDTKYPSDPDYAGDFTYVEDLDYRGGLRRIGAYSA